MVFSSPIFVFYFLPLALLAYFAARGPARLTMLAAFSYLFYGWASPWFAGILLWTTVVDFVAGNFVGGHWNVIGTPTTYERGRRVASLAQRRLFLTLSLCNSLGMLFVFKYAVFVQQNLNWIAQAFGRPAMTVAAIALPTGISFYTFESISYVVDIFKGRARPASEWVFRRGGRGWRGELEAFRAFACYLVQFPHLVAGPIVRYQDLEPQLYEPDINSDNFARGVFFFCFGLAKKVLIADVAGAAADASFDADVRHFGEAWFGVFAYAMQIYFDFSGYSDMAIGLALMLGFKFLKNFDSPYKATSVTDFWRRWHISLSTWLRAYLYIPLGGNRRGPARTYVNLIVVMLLGGLWHGAAWKFVLWGGLHGCALAVERAIRGRGWLLPMPRPLLVAITFVFVCFTWVPFRAADMGKAWRYFADMLGFSTAVNDLASPRFYSPEMWVTLVLAGAVAFFGVQTWDLSERINLRRAVAAMALLLVSLIYLSASAYHPFLYFQF